MQPGVVFGELLGKSVLWFPAGVNVKPSARGSVPHPEAAAHALRIDNRHGALATLSGLRTPSSREIWMSLASNRMQYLPIIDRPVIKWPNDARVAFWVAPNVEHYQYLPTYDGKRNPWPRSPYPDDRAIRISIMETV